MTTFPYPHFVKQVPVLLCLLSILSAGCNLKAKESGAQQSPVPDALQANNTLEFTLNKGREDMVDALYADQLKSNPALQHLQQKLEQVPEKVNDSTKPYKGYKDISNSYYTSASSHLNQVKDSLLKQQLVSVINQSKERFQQKTTRQEALMKDITSRQYAIQDLEETLRILLTLPVIQNYQDSKLPSPKSLDSLLKELDRLKAEMEEIKKKHGGG